jgi:hypothetical protein
VIIDEYGKRRNFRWTTMSTWMGDMRRDSNVNYPNEEMKIRSGTVG